MFRLVRRGKKREEAGKEVLKPGGKVLFSSKQVCQASHTALDSLRVYISPGFKRKSREESRVFKMDFTTN